ncbi:AraC family transcriptional regulator [Mammaliicoccus sciuri]|nr:helix-turn-helix domain-containing protein [Mammaliicoccus sciuri]MCE4981601.1 AraC family transcriptional regulator [Mammaliicoccus sciuri]MCE5086496.1 AraC family transcriptional regulator [Mammaliicoccus sciuri]MCE5095963.1 AraC family transcriptional regulator [Mammaliicoccus sciuri]
MLNKHTDKSITDISYACGFSTTSYFIQKFKERYGQTPKKFLKQIKK